MSESDKKVNMVYNTVYYILAPALLLYFFGTDLGFWKISAVPLLIFTILIVSGVAVGVLYKKKNKEYDYKVNDIYSKIMSVLVVLELVYSFSK